MAVNAYLVIDGRPGPSTSRQDAIDILSFGFGSTQNSVIGSGSSGGAARAGRADVSNVTIMKILDKTSPLLFAPGNKKPCVDFRSLQAGTKRRARFSYDDLPGLFTCYKFAECGVPHSSPVLA